jgi:hypothetical protein
MARYPFNFGPNTNPARIRQLGDNAIVNGFIEQLDEPGKDDTSYGANTDAGLVVFADLSANGATSTRGEFFVEGALYGAAGERLYKINAVGVVSEIGPLSGVLPIITSTNRNVSGAQTVITTETDVYEMQGDVLQLFQDPDILSNVVGTTYMDGYTIILGRSGIFQITSTLTDDLEIDPLDFAEAEARGDQGVLPLAYESKLWLAGQRTIEVWTNTGAAAFPFERDTVIERGVLSKYAFCPFDETLAFVDDLGRAVRLVGYGVQVFSTPAVERDIRRTMDIQQPYRIEGYAWATPGHQFFVLMGHDWTWVYDAATKTWHPKESHVRTYWKSRGYTRAYDKHIVGSKVEAKLYEMDHDLEDEAGEPLVLRLKSPIIGSVDLVTEFNQVDIDVNMAAGLNSADLDESDPQVGLRWSDNGGHTWSHQRIQPMGRIGLVGEGRIRMTRLGTCMNGRGRMFELLLSHPVKRMVVEAVAQVEEYNA